MTDPLVLAAVGWLRARLDEDEQWAREASRPYGQYTESGEHWRWEGENTDQPVTIDPMLGEFVEGHDYEPIGLRSAETYPSRSGSVGDLVHLVIRGQEELEPAVAGHIARWDPARVLAEVAAKRDLLAVLLDYEAAIDAEWGCCHSAADIAAGACPDRSLMWAAALKALARPYADRPDFPEVLRA